MCFDHFLKFFGLFVVDLDSLDHIRKGQDFICRHCPAGINELFHQLVIGYAEIAPSPQSSTGIHNVTHQDPAGGMQDLIDGEVGGIYLIYRLHHIIKLWKFIPASIIFINNTGAGWGNAALTFIFSFQLLSFMFTGMMVEPEPASRYKWYIGKAVILSDLNQTILQIFWVGKFPVIDDPCFL